MFFYSEALSLPRTKIICAAFADICSQSLGDKPHLVDQDKHMLYPHKAALALQAEISLPTGEIPKKKAYEQRLEARGFLSTFFNENDTSLEGTGMK